MNFILSQVFLTYAVPALIGVAVEPEFGLDANSSWVEGGFSRLAAKQVKSNASIFLLFSFSFAKVPWLGYAMDASGALSNLGQYCACLAAVGKKEKET